MSTINRAGSTAHRPSIHAWCIIYGRKEGWQFQTLLVRDVAVMYSLMIKPLLLKDYQPQPIYALQFSINY